MKKKPETVYTLFGFKRDSVNETGWVRLGKAGMEVVPDRESAFEFRIDDPDPMVEFVNSEPELSCWKFHAVKGFPLSAVNSRKI